MNQRSGAIALWLLILALAAFTWITSSTLPAFVASHFDFGGAANGFMPRGSYIAVLMVLIVGVPLLIALLPLAVGGTEGANLKIPDRDYRLAPERRDSTLGFVRMHGQWFAAAVALFLAYVHWLVVQANQLRPPMLSTTGVTAGLAVFFAVLTVWLAMLHGRFRRRGGST